MISRAWAIAVLLALGAAAEPVHFADPNLEAAVREALALRGVLPGEQIDDLDLVGKGFTRLDASRRCIKSLEGLQYCLDLNFAELSYNEIADLTPLAGLTRLECLFLGIFDFEATPSQAIPEPAAEYVRNNLITDITPLAGLHNLNYLDLAGNNALEDLSVLAHLPKLEWLVIGRNKVRDYSFLAAMPQLANFANFYGGMTDADLALLKPNIKMMRLGIAFNEITTLEPLANFPIIYALLAQGNKITDISALEKLPRLEYIFLQGNHITDLGPLARNEGVGYRDFFNLGDNPISIVSACRDLPVIRARFDVHGKFGCEAPCGEALALTLAASGQGTTVPPPGQHQYVKGSRVSVIAQPVAGAGAAFDHWVGAVEEPASPVASVEMSVPRMLEAVFAPQGDHTLMVNLIGGGAGEVLPGIGGPFAYRHGRLAVLNAKPTEGQYFGGWSGDVQSLEPTVTIEMDRDKTVTARFSIHAQTLTILAAEGGTTTPPPGEYTYARGATVQLRARAAAGHEFVGWRGNLPPEISASTAARVTLGHDLTLTPKFVAR